MTPWLSGPPWWPVGEYRAALGHSAAKLLSRAGTNYRVELCRNNPLIFGLLYFTGADVPGIRLTLDDGRVALNDVHCDLARIGRRLRERTEPGTHRWTVYAPRGSAKSTWAVVIMLWALVFGHRRFVAMFGASGKQIRETHFSNIRATIRGNELFRADFARFCAPDGDAGSDTSSQFVSSTGAVIVARGIDEANQGLNVRGSRPDAILLDDIEDDEGNFSYAKKAKRLQTIRQSLLGMNPRAAVLWTGVTVAHGCLGHDLVRHQLGEGNHDWVRETGFRTLHHPAIINEAGMVRSLWPEVWPLDYLVSQLGMRDFELNLINRPLVSGGTLWEQRHFVYGIPSHWDIIKRALWIDPAVTNTNTSDFTGLAVGGYAGNVRKIGILSSASIRVSPDGLNRNVRAVKQHYPDLVEVHVESNQGADYVAHALAGIPGIKVIPHHTGSGKGVEFGKAFAHYERSRVNHARQFRVAEEQMMQFPNGDFDDGADAVCRIISELLSHLPTAEKVH